MEYVVLIIGFLLLIKGADFFVDGSSSVAKILDVPSIIIGLTVVAFGTSMPELSVSVTAALKGANALAISNVIGSNIFNLLIVLGASALVAPITAKWSVLKKEFPFSLVISVILLFCLANFAFGDIIAGKGEYILSRTAGVVFLILFVWFVGSTVKDALLARSEFLASGEPEEEIKTLTPVRSAVYILLGLIGIVFGGDLVVDSASTIGANFGMSQTFIGLTIVALGTSLPELVTSMVAAKKGENDLAVGNVVGSNIFNILLILGISATISPITVDVLAVYDAAVLILATIIVYLCAVSKRGISRGEGGVFLICYVGYFFYILCR